MTKHLKQKATNAFIWDMVGVFAKQGVAFIVSIFLARMLLPAEFGLVAMALVFISISQVFADFGFASALIQNKENTSLTYSSIFFVNIAVGIFLFVLFWFIAPWIGVFYENDQITALVRYLSLNFILSSFNQVQQTILRKNIEFKKITIRITIAYLLSGIIAIYLAYDGWGVYALVVQNLSASVINTLILWRIAEWKPRFEFSWQEVKKLSGFSVYVFLSQVSTKLVTQLDTLVVGKVFSAGTLGLYSRASSLNSLVTSFSSTSISRVSFPVMSHIQDDPERFERAYFKMVELIAFASFCLSGALIFAGPDIIRILYGENWVASIFIFQILVLQSFTYPINLLIVNTYLAAGKSKENFWFGNIKKVMMLTPLIFAILYGFDAFLYAVVSVGYINWILNNWFVTISFKISLLRQVKLIVPYLLNFVIVGLSLYGLMDYFSIVFPFSGITVALIFTGVYIGVNWSLKTQGYSYFIEYIQPVWKQLKRKFEAS